MARKMSKAASLLLFFKAIISCDGLDLQFDRIQCDQSLPAYAADGEFTVTCNGNKRCSFGDTALISGLLHYVNMYESGLVNTTGYASADLKLMTLEYDLFEDLPFNFCGDFIKRSAYNFDYCPQNGKYHFEVPYALPKQHEDYASWFATGWKGTSYLTIHAGRSSTNSTMLAHCKLDFKTFVTQSQNSGWQTLPSAAVTTFILFGIVICLMSTLFCMACGPRRKHITDEIYEREFHKLNDDETKQKKKPKKPQLSLQAQAEADWVPQGDGDWSPTSPKGKALQAEVEMKEAEQKGTQSV